MKIFLPFALAILLCGTAAFAQDAPPPDELLALNFYVQQKDQSAIDAELRRLQLKYPQWTPPADLAQLAVTGPTTEIDEIFRQIAAGRLADARATIAATQGKFPSWQPPEDMMTLLNTAEGQVALDTALSAGEIDKSIEIASTTPGLLRCDRINNAWRIAEGQAAAGRTADSLATYKAVLSACTNFPDITASLEKADAVSTADELSALFTQAEGRFPDETDELKALQARLVAGRATPKEGRPQEAVGTTQQVQPRQAAAPLPRPKPDSQTAAADASSGGAGGSLGRIRSAAAAGDWARCAALSAGATSAAVVYERAWCVYNLDRPMEALSDFRAAGAGRLSKVQQRDARFGMALAYLKLKMPEEAARLAAATDFTRDQRVDIEGQILDQRGVAAYRRSQYSQAINYFNALEQLRGGLRRDLAVLRAYAYLNSGNRAEARRQFKALDNQLSTGETRRGIRATDSN